MGLQSSVVRPEEGMILAYSAVYIPSPTEYATSMIHFPATNAAGVWSQKGVFFASMDIYEHSSLSATVNSNWQDQDGIVKILTDDYFGLKSNSKSSLGILKYWHPKTIPVAGYLSLVHRKTGTYAPLPVLQYMGDEIFPDFHDTVLETALFWPGVISDEQTSQTIVILNPYSTSFLYQLHLFISDKETISSPVTKIPAYAVKEHVIDEEFAAHLDRIRESNGRCSLCVAAQYKVLPLMIIKDRAQGIISGVDHLHPYALF